MASPSSDWIRWIPVESSRPRNWRGEPKLQVWRLLIDDNGIGGATFES